MNSGSLVRVSSFAGSMLATIHLLRTWTRCSRMRPLFLLIVRAAGSASKIRKRSWGAEIVAKRRNKFLLCWGSGQSWPEATLQKGGPLQSMLQGRLCCSGIADGLQAWGWQLAAVRLPPGPGCEFGRGTQTKPQMQRPGHTGRKALAKKKTLQSMLRGKCKV